MKHSEAITQPIPLTLLRERRQEKRLADLAFAISSGLDKRIAPLIEAGADPNGFSPKGDTPLLLAARLNAGPCLRALLDAGAKVDLANKEGVTPLLRAANLGFADIVKLLLQGGADPDQRDPHENTPLCLAARRGHMACVKALLQGGADANHAGGAHLWVPLMFAARFSTVDIVKVLVEGGADVSRADIEGRTVMYFAAWGDNAETIRFLKARGADPKGSGSFAPIKVALTNESDSSECVRLLLSYEDVDVPDHLNSQEAVRLFRALWDLTNPDVLNEFILGTSPAKEFARPVLRLI